VEFKNKWHNIQCKRRSKGNAASAFAQVEVLPGGPDLSFPQDCLQLLCFSSQTDTRESFPLRRSVFDIACFYFRNRLNNERPFGVWRLAFGIWRLAFGVWRLAFGVAGVMAFSPACSRDSRTVSRRLHAMTGLASFLTVRLSRPGTRVPSIGQSPLISVSQLFISERSGRLKPGGGSL
jgi:hypothetical protein